MKSFGSQGTGGALVEGGGAEWEKWREKLKTVVVKNQRQDAAMMGSWDPVGVWGETGGRVYSTAMGVLALQTCY